jgi:deazaflavin-dependent oxidoreductase (nitroreductase family)
MEGVIHMSVSPVNTEKSKLFSALSSVLRHKPMRPVVRLFTQLHVVLYRLTNGKAQIKKYPTLLLTVRGRKTGKLRTIPLIYIPDGKRFVIAAAYSGSDQNPAWWLNLQQSGEALVQMMDRKVRVRAVLATPSERQSLWPRLVAMYPYFTEYQERTERQIPVVILEPIADQPVSSAS